MKCSGDERCNEGSSLLCQSPEIIFCRTKGIDGGRFCTKILLLHDVDLTDFFETVKEEMREFKVYLKKQTVAHHSTETIGWYIKLHADVDVRSIKSMFDEEVKKKVDFTPDFALVNREIFNGEKSQIS